jgi:DNA-binding MarR family transcriptional regulator
MTAMASSARRGAAETGVTEADQPGHVSAHDRHAERAASGPADAEAHDDPRWLSPLEQRAWRAFVSASLVVTAELEADLMARHRLSLGEYAVLANLSESEDRRLRMTDLAQQLSLSPSGLTRRLDRLVREGFVARESCPTDRRSVYAALTEAGLAKLAKAAPDHVAGVRRLVVDRLDRYQLAELADVLEQVRAGCPGSDQG